ncbi:hypothetical protein RRG08_007777 [Elysia crispata]|uniref:Uncharacterized protein n=1 Tax=Elysia crispata TaxID=231223 RepID=A0AAE1B3K0_9GAST|nr:hypothetical protein RRG08_007777 [Elysia crispata]
MYLSFPAHLSESSSRRLERVHPSLWLKQPHADRSYPNCEEWRVTAILLLEQNREYQRVESRLSDSIVRTPRGVLVTHIHVSFCARLYDGFHQRTATIHHEPRIWEGVWRLAWQRISVSAWEPPSGGGLASVC